MAFSQRSTHQLCLPLQRRITLPGARYPRNASSRRTIVQESEASDRYTRISRFWLAAGGINKAKNEDGHAKLIRAGYLRQSHAGIFHILPLGDRVQTKLEKLIDKHMSQLGASKVQLSSISSCGLWEKTGRLKGYGKELFRFTDQKELGYILAPTHEEEITTLVANTVKSYKSLPLRLYQIGRKYRDEIRPRHGLLRSREFVMKDLYTFDYSLKSALDTYEEARTAYRRFFDELKLPYIVAEASSGDIGGDLSHEYHLPSPIGEDNVISCTDCHYITNEELATARPDVVQDEPSESSNEAQVWRVISKDRQRLVNVWYPASFQRSDVNTHALKSVMPDLDLSFSHASSMWEAALSRLDPPTPGQELQLLNIVDYRLGPKFADSLQNEPGRFPILPPESAEKVSQLNQSHITSSTTGEPFNAIRIRDGDHCPRCTTGTLKVQKAIELGHTFHLGTKYSSALKARVQVPMAKAEPGEAAPTADDQAGDAAIQMGCHGIGVSRIIGAVAEHLSDDRGLNWPRVIAPFEAVVIPRQIPLDNKGDAVSIARSLSREMPTSRAVDVALDDRDSVDFSWKMKDADLIGYPVVIILGAKWESDGLCEVQCRRLKSVDFVQPGALREHVNGLLAQL
ncbi:class II aaRS and biotin synthetase [Xylaria intraflava]|nr:class II aaRS and biotin synthetase [Xylaria intraflava]